MAASPEKLQRMMEELNARFDLGEKKIEGRFANQNFELTRTAGGFQLRETGEHGNPQLTVCFDGNFHISMVHGEKAWHATPDLVRTIIDRILEDQAEMALRKK